MHLFLLLLCSDLAIMDEDGYGYIVGRIKDMVIRGGENIYPLEIEQFLYEHPKIEDVQVNIIKIEINLSFTLVSIEVMF